MFSSLEGFREDSLDLLSSSTPFAPVSYDDPWPGARLKQRAADFAS